MGDLNSVNDIASKDMPWDIATLVDLAVIDQSPRIMVSFYAVWRILSESRWKTIDICSNLAIRALFVPKNSILTIFETIILCIAVLFSA